MANNLRGENHSDNPTTPRTPSENIPSQENINSPSFIPQEDAQVSSPKRKPSLRTMQSDAQELMEGKKLTLADMVGQAVRKSSREKSFAAPQNAAWFLKRALALGGILLFFAALGGALWFFFFRAPRPETLPQETPAQKEFPLFFRVNFSETLSAEPDNRTQFTGALQQLAQKPELPGAITRIAATRARGANGGSLSLGDLLLFFRVVSPDTLNLPLDTIPMFFIFYGGDGGRIGFLFAPENPDRAFSAFFARERSLAFDFEQIFLGEVLARPLAPFQDFTYRNIDWRYQAISQEKDQGIGYGIFPNKKLFIMTTSKAAMEEVIDRLFE